MRPPRPAPAPHLRRRARPRGGARDHRRDPGTGGCGPRRNHRQPGGPGRGLCRRPGQRAERGHLHRLAELPRRRHPGAPAGGGDPPSGGSAPRGDRGPGPRSGRRTIVSWPPPCSPSASSRRLLRPRGPGEPDRGIGACRRRLRRGHAHGADSAHPGPLAPEGSGGCGGHVGRRARPADRWWPSSPGWERSGPPPAWTGCWRPPRSSGWWWWASPGPSTRRPRSGPWSGRHWWWTEPRAPGTDPNPWARRPRRESCGPRTR